MSSDEASSTASTELATPAAVAAATTTNGKYSSHIELAPTKATSTTNGRHHFDGRSSVPSVSASGSGSLSVSIPTRSHSAVDFLIHKTEYGPEDLLYDTKPKNLPEMSITSLKPHTVTVKVGSPVPQHLEMNESAVQIKTENMSDTSAGDDYNRNKFRSRSKRTSSSSAVSSSQPYSAMNEEAPCAWCSEIKPLGFVLPTLSGERDFCSELCIIAFRDALKKGACTLCGNLIRENVAPNELFCSTYCLNKNQMTKNGILHSNNNNNDHNNHNNNNTPNHNHHNNGALSKSVNNNNNNNYHKKSHRDTGDGVSSSNTAKRNSPTHSAPRSFQYESFNIFDWNEYLLVSNLL